LPCIFTFVLYPLRYSTYETLDFITDKENIFNRYYVTRYRHVSFSWKKSLSREWRILYKELGIGLTKKKIIRSWTYISSRYNIKVKFFFSGYIMETCRSKCLCGLRRGSAADRLLGLWYRIPLRYGR
jgi:hypothetical protein